MWSRETENWCYLCQYIEWCDHEKQRTGATFVNILNDVITRNRELVLPLSMYWMMWSRETEHWCYLCQYIEWCDNEKQRTGATFVNILNDVITRNRELVLPLSIYWMMWSRETENWCYLCQYIEWCDHEKQSTGATFVNILNDVITRNRELVLPLSIYWMMWSRETENWCYLCQYIEWCDHEKQRTGATLVNIYWRMWPQGNCCCTVLQFSVFLDTCFTELTI